MSRVFLAGASGVIGRRLIPLLVDAGHVVGGMTRSGTKAQLLAGLGAQPFVVDVFDREALAAAVGAFSCPTGQPQAPSPSWSGRCSRRGASC